MTSNSSFDVAVVGGGIIGLSAAWRLSQRGLSVVVADANRMAAEASEAGAGMLAPGGEAHHVSAWARDTVEARRLYPAFVAEVQSESGVAMDFAECGAVEIASSPEAWVALCQRRIVQQELGIAVEEIPEAAARSLLPLLHAGDLRALHYPDDAVVDPRPINLGLCVLLKRAGARLIENTTVLELSPEGTGYRLVTGSEGAAQSIVAQTVIVAAGAWSSTIRLPEGGSGVEPPRQAIPIRGHLCCCERAPGTVRKIVREGATYLFQRTRGEIVVGSTEERVGFDRNLNPSAVEDILARTERLLPGLFPPEGPSGSWLGFRPGIEGEGPEIRQYGDTRIWLAYGHYRNGLLLAPHTAARLSREIAG